MSLGRACQTEIGPQGTTCSEFHPWIALTTLTLPPSIIFLGYPQARARDFQPMIQLRQILELLTPKISSVSELGCDRLRSLWQSLAAGGIHESHQCPRACPGAQVLSGAARRQLSYKVGKGAFLHAGSGVCYKCSSMHSTLGRT